MRVRSERSVRKVRRRRPPGQDGVPLLGTVQPPEARERVGIEPAKLCYNHEGCSLENFPNVKHLIDMNDYQKVK